jgi:hypothetical protein
VVDKLLNKAVVRIFLTAACFFQPEKHNDTTAFSILSTANYFQAIAICFLVTANYLLATAVYFLRTENYFLAPAICFLAVENYFLATAKIKRPIANQILLKASSRRTAMGSLINPERLNVDRKTMMIKTHAPWGSNTFCASSFYTHTMPPAS